MKNKINLTFLAFILCSVFIWNACETDEMLNELPTIYGQVEGISINSGRYRVELALDDLTEDVTSVDVKYWPGLLTGKSKSVQFATFGNKSVKYVIDNLEEEVYSFDVTLFLKDGTSVHKGQPKGRSYGTAYEKELANRKLLQYTFETLTEGNMVWDEIPDGLLYSEVVYLSTNGMVEKTLLIEENEVSITEFAGKHIAYRSLFIPNESAIDTFTAIYDTLVVVPAVPIEPFPTVGGDADLKPELLWKPSLGTVKQILYMGLDEASLVPVDTLTKGYFALEELIQNTTYFWRVDPVSDVGFSQTGEVWDFTTKTVDKVTMMSPLAGSEGVSLLPVVTWESADYIKGHNIYLGTSEDELTLVAENLKGTWAVPGVLQGNQDYFMRIDALGGDSVVNTAIGDVIKFSTANGGFVNFHRSDKADLERAFNYTAEHEKEATFSKQFFPMFGTSVSLAPHWADDASNKCMQMIYRSYHNYPNLYVPKFFSDWIGTDTRQPGNPMTLVIGGLPEGTYNWRSWHYDNDNQTGAFNATLFDAAGDSLICEAFDIKDKAKDFKNIDKNFKEVPTLDMTIVSNGVDDVKIDFEMVYPYGTSTIYKFFLMNGFELIKQE